MTGTSPGIDDGIKIDILESLEGIDGVASAWTELEARLIERATFFQSYAWCRAVMSVRDSETDGEVRPFIVTAWMDGTLKAVWPLGLFRHGPCRLLRSIDEPFGQFGQALIDPDVDPAAIIDVMIEAIRHVSPADGFLMAKVARNSVLHRSFTTSGARRTLSDQTVFLDLSNFADFDSYQQTLSAKTRKNMRNARNRLTKDYEIEHEVTTDRESLAVMIQEAIDGRMDWMQAEGKTSPAFRDDLFTLLLNALPRSEPSISLIGFRLKTSDTTIAVQWGFLHRNCYYAYLSARNQDFAAYSVGRLHLGMIIRACAEQKIDRLELMSPASHYKLNWTKSLTDIDDFVLPLTLAGYLYLNLWHGGLRVVLKNTYYQLPLRLKKQLRGMALAMR